MLLTGINILLTLLQAGLADMDIVWMIPTSNNLSHHLSSDGFEWLYCACFPIHSPTLNRCSALATDSTCMMTSKSSSSSRTELLKMSVIIRLQGLPWSASALDIRHFFKGLTIPAGGVHIIGGDRGDAFIAFSSDEDARQGMMRNMSAINGTTVQLYLSSKSEMQSVIEEARSAESGVAAVGGGVCCRRPDGDAAADCCGGGHAARCRAAR